MDHLLMHRDTCHPCTGTDYEAAKYFDAFWPRTTITGTVLWVSTFTVSLPSTIAETPRRPCEAITIASHPLALAVSMIATYGCSCSTCTTLQGTPAFVAASFATSRYLAVSA